MPRTYSYDLRQKVINAIELDGLKKKEASDLFGISRNTINLWFQRRVQTGDYRAKSSGQYQRRQKIEDWEHFRQFVRANSDKTQEQLAQLWPGDVSARTICRALKKIGFTRKKRLTATANATKPNVRYFWSD